MGVYTYIKVVSISELWGINFGQAIAEYQKANLCFTTFGSGNIFL